jgi:hypothetical protein
MRYDIRARKEACAESFARGSIVVTDSKVVQCEAEVTGREEPGLRRLYNSHVPNYMSY